MRITIDTKSDSKDEIRKAIKLLLGLIGSHEVYTNEPEKPASQPNIFDNPSPAVGNLMSMFDNAPTPEEPKQEKKDVQELEFY